MRFTILLSLLSVSLAAQTINPNQIKPSPTNGQIITTVGGTTVWAAAPSGSSGITGQTSGQVSIAGSSTTITSSIPIAGTGAALTSGPTSAGAGDVVVYTGTNGQTTDSTILLTGLAPKVSPALTGIPTAPTAAPGTNSTQVATTAFVQANAGGGGLSGQTANCVPKAATATTSTGPAAICDDGTKVTITEPVVVNTGSGLGGGMDAPEGTAHTGSSLVDNLWADSADHHWKMINNSGTATDLVGFSDLGSSSAFGLLKCGSGTTCSGGTITVAAGSVTAVTGTSPIVSSGGATPAISCATCTVTIASGTSALGTSAILSGACATVVTTTATGVASTDAIAWNPNGSIKAVTGYIPGTAGGLTIAAYPTSGNVNFDVCNWSAASITPGAVTLNWRVTR